jgi:hypothetical protein
MVKKHNSMSNVLENRVSTTFAKEELDKMAAQRNSFMAIIKPKTVALNETELSSLSSISVDNFVFVKDTVTATDAEGAALLPPAIATLAIELDKDVTFYEQLDAEEATLTDVLTRLQHTKRLVAHESYMVANAIYEQYQSLANAGVPGAATRYNILKERYKHNGGGRPAEPAQ